MPGKSYLRHGFTLRLNFPLLTEIWDRRCWHQKSRHFQSYFQSKNGNKYCR